MAPETLQTLDALLRLPAEQRMEIAQALYESIYDNDELDNIGLTAEESEELERRYQNYLQNPSSAIPWSEVCRRAEKLL